MVVKALCRCGRTFSRWRCNLLPKAPQNVSVVSVITPQLTRKKDHVSQPTSLHRHGHCSLEPSRRDAFNVSRLLIMRAFNKAGGNVVFPLSFIHYFSRQTSSIGMLHQLFLAATIAVLSCITFADANAELMSKLVKQYQENTKQRLPQYGGCTEGNIVQRKEW